MFYMQLLMNKRGPLAKIWLAAHWDKKVTKAHIFECNLETTIEKMLSPKFTIALRTSGHLLLGVVRIYHRKAKYLLEDCNEALLKMQTTFRPGLVDLPKGNAEANYDAITLPEEFHDFGTQLPDVNAIDVAQHFTLNQSRVEDITLIEEDYRLLQSDSFGGDIEMPRQSGFFSDSFLVTPSPSDVLADHSSFSITADKNELDESLSILKHDGFGDEGIAEDMIDNVLGAEQNSLIALFDTEGETHLSPNLPGDDTIATPRFEQEARSHPINETTLLSNEEEGFVLEPIEVSVHIKRQRSKRKRRLLVDIEKEISRSAMENQFMDYKDTLTTLDIAPPTKRLMILKELGSMDKLLSTPTQPLINEDLKKLFVRSLKNGRKTLQQEAEVEERSKEQAAKKPREEGPNNLQDSFSLEARSLLQNDRNEENSNVTFEVTEAANILSTLSDGASLDVSVRQESENEQAAKENELQGSDLENEEKRRCKRTLELLHIFQRMDQTGAKSFSFLALCRNNKKKQVASKFHSLLVLKKQQAVKLAQPAPYADILVTVGPKFYVL
uniref:Double-strand-break repair protein rad21-like protein 1 n=1 Tax=Pogona vitticeps TaxID=103695 RepID=A0ABM5G529_9SAUR